jgi:hypothetical protein
MSFVAAGVTVGLGATEAIVGGIKAGKAHSALEKLQTPTYTPNKAIADYYQSALDRYNTSPYQSNFYQQAQKNAGRNLATGIGALQDRHSAGNIGALVQGSDDQLQRAGVQAEGMQRQNFAQLGQAANMQANDARTAFGYNQEAPYEKQFGIDQAKAIAGSQQENAGFQSALGGIGGYNQMNLYKQLLGNSNGRNSQNQAFQGQPGLGYQYNSSGDGGIAPE